MSTRGRRAVVSLAPIPPRRVPVADEAWGNEYHAQQEEEHQRAPTPTASTATRPPPPPRRPLLSSLLASACQKDNLPTLRGLCLACLAQHAFLLEDAAAEDPELLRQAMPSADDRLAICAALRRRHQLSARLLLALCDPAWPVLCLGPSASQPPARAVVEAARAGLLRGLKRVEWVLPCEQASDAGGAAAGAAAEVLLPSEAAAVVRALAAHCPLLEVLALRRADPTRRTRPAVAAALSRAVLAAALPKTLDGGGLLLLGTGRRRRKDQEEEEEEEEADAKADASPPPAADCWEDAAAPVAMATTTTDAPEHLEARATFAPSFRLLQWPDLARAAADAMRTRCPRIALECEAVATTPSPPLDHPWMAIFARAAWDDRGAEQAERRAEERRAREEARRRKLLLLGDGGAEDEEEEKEEEEEEDGKAREGEARDANVPAPDENDDQEDDSIAERFRRAYVERAERLKAVERAKEEQRRRRAVRASPGLALVERWLDEPV